MNEEQKFEVGDLVKLEGWNEYCPISGVDYPYISFGNWARASWYSTYNHKFTKYVEKENEMQNTESKKDMQENKTEDTFKVGDTVWCLIRGKGVVRMVLTAKDFQHYPVIVDFSDITNTDTGVRYTNRHSYSKDGKWSQEFIFSEPKIEALTTRPFTHTLIGKSVLVVTEYDSKYVSKVRDECKETFTDDMNQKYYKDFIKELYILGENVVNSIK